MSTTDDGALQLYSGAPYWLLANGLQEMATPPRTAADVAIVGAGVTGALVADALTDEGLNVVVLDRRAPGYGSTAASTALLQYEIDTELHELIERIGEGNAVRAYRLCAESIERLEEICLSLGDDCGLARRPSLYLASRRRDAKRLERECTTRLRFGFDVESWSEAEVTGRYGFPSHGALRTGHAGVVDPVRLTRSLLQRAVRRGASLMTRTTVVDAGSTPTGVRLTTDRGIVDARQVIYALGYEVPPMLRRELVNLNSTYALVTEPVESFGKWDDECLVWETARPYVYARTTPDRRVLCGGADLPFKNERLRDRALPARIERLEWRMQQLFPELGLRTAFTWASTFGETKDGLPFIGASPLMPNAYFALGYGGNGITFGVVAADILRDLCLKRPNSDARIFRLDR